jgi:transcriptional regulator with XRE-family HTH domain
MTQTQLGKAVGWKDGAVVSAIERGKYPNPGSDVRERIAKVLGVSVEKLLKKRSAPAGRLPVAPKTAKTPVLSDVAASLSGWEIDPEKKLLMRKLDSGITFIVPIGDLRNEAGLVTWIRTLMTQPWADDAMLGCLARIGLLSETE